MFTVIKIITEVLGRILDHSSAVVCTICIRTRKPNIRPTNRRQVHQRYNNYLSTPPHYIQHAFNHFTLIYIPGVGIYKQLKTFMKILLIVDFSSGLLFFMNFLHTMLSVHKVEINLLRGNIFGATVCKLSFVCISHNIQITDSSNLSH